jgi:hypothetical protein
VYGHRKEDQLSRFSGVPLARSAKTIWLSETRCLRSMKLGNRRICTDIGVNNAAEDVERFDER